MSGRCRWWIGRRGRFCSWWWGGSVLLRLGRGTSLVALIGDSEQVQVTPVRESAHHLLNLIRDRW